MQLFDHPDFDRHEKVLFIEGAASGLRAIIALHDTTLGPALGGCRYWRYASEAEAVTDALRLSRGMTYKSALAGLDLGGGKSVILADPARPKTPALLRAMGRAVDSLGGLYTVAEDVGISLAEVETMAETTRHVAGIRAGGAGDPSPATAFGVFTGLRAAVRHGLGRSDLEGLRVAVQGLGSVGFELCRLLHGAGARLIVADLDAARVAKAVESFDAVAAEPQGILAAEAEVFAPCALGAVIDDAALELLQARVIAGAANNQLAEPRHGEALRARGILYAPDYAINAGGIVNIAHEAGRAGPRYDREQAYAAIARIGETLTEIFRRAGREGLATSTAADRLAEERLRAARRAAA